MQGLFFPLLTLLGGLSALTVLYAGGRLVMAGTVTVGQFVAFGIYLGMLVWPMIALGWAVNLVQRGAASMGRINQLFREKPAITGADPPRCPPTRGGGRSVEFRGRLLRVSRAPESGDGCSGTSRFGSRQENRSRWWGRPAPESPRSSISSCAPTIADKGAILFDGRDIRQLSLAELRRTVGFVPQETFLFSETLRNNVLLGAPDDGRLEGVAEVSQLTEALPALPAGYDTMLGERGINLSGGQKQRAAIARALAQDPPIFVLDDALSAVDAQTEAKILRALRGALRGRTSIIVSHRLAAVRDADAILVLDEGQIVERGTHTELIARRRTVLGVTAAATIGGRTRREGSGLSLRGSP